MNKYNTDLDKCQANHQALTPIRFLKRSADVFPDRTAVIYKDRSYTWSEYSDRCHQLARALMGAGVGRGDTVAIMAANIPAMLEAHFGVPMSGAVLNCINIRLDSSAIAFMLRHGEAKAFLVDQEFSDVAKSAVEEAGLDILVIDIADKHLESGGSIGTIEYEEFIKQAP